MGAHSRRVALAAALASLAPLWGLASESTPEPPPAGVDSATEAVRKVIREDRAESEWGAEPAAFAASERGEPVAVTILSGTGHALLAFGSDGKPLGAHLWLVHARLEGDAASATECVLRLGRDDDRSCPPQPSSLVDCTTWSVPAEALRAAARAAREALFVRVYEKKYLGDPREEYEDTGEVGGVMGGIAGGSSHNFVMVANVVEAGAHRVRVAAEWAGYESLNDVGRYARVVAAARLMFDAFPRPKDAAASDPPAAAHAEFSRLFANLPLDADFWWWVHERMVLMAGTLGTPADLERLEGYLTPNEPGSSDPGMRSYALEALARRTGRDTRCEGTRRLDDVAAARAWRREPPAPP